MSGCGGWGRARAPRGQVERRWSGQRAQRLGRGAAAGHGERREMAAARTSTRERGQACATAAHERGLAQYAARRPAGASAGGKGQLGIAAVMSFSSREGEGRKTRTTQTSTDVRAPPGPPKQLPVLGDLLQIGNQPHRYFQAMAQRYGPVVQVQLGRVQTVVVSSPEMAKEVLRTNDAQCCPRMLSYGFLDVAFSPYSDYWREMRKLFSLELLRMRCHQSFAYVRAAEVHRLVDSIANSPLATPIDLSEKLYALNDGIIGTVAFGKMYGSAQFQRSSFQ
ncbi:hypothetical protein PR202_ga31337 [Eleusine coracana subsp. coracana]|uniref:Uncharacterized protein n=1 Tax=Eleusine coracana subsp. coracana TaxID=191504 RepID=A0AAV5DPP9_ELECO|nr:hypothetical protein PR202_ga31337 [Eleusine coracana subsp. coracana]